MNKFNEKSYTERLECWIRDNYSRYTLSLGFITVAILVTYALPSLLGKEHFHRDIQQFVSWSYNYQDPELFNNYDLIKDYFASNTPLGYKFFYRVFATLIDPYILGIFLALSLQSCTAFLSYLIGRQVSDGKHWGGLASLTLFLFSTFPTNVRSLDFIGLMTGGIPRNFALPLILLGTLSLLRYNFASLGVTLVLATLFYPPAFITLITYSIFTFLWQFLKERRINRQWLKTIFGSALATSIILFWRRTSTNINFGDPYSLKQSLQMDEFHEGGILPILSEDWKMYAFDILQIWGNKSSFIWLSIIVTTVIITARNKANAPKLLRPEIVALYLSALVNYGLAYLIFIKLYEPSRYITYAGQCLSLCVFPFTFNLTLKSIQVILARDNNPKLLFGKSDFKWLIIILTIFTITFTLPKKDAAIAAPCNASSMLLSKDIYQFLKTLPKDVIIAAHPCDASNIPILSQRSVLLMETALYPYNVKFYEKMKDRLTAIYEAMYATDVQPFLELQNKYKVSYFILNKNLYKHDTITYQPFQKQLKKFRDNLGNREPLISLLAKRDAMAFQKDKFYILNLEKLIDNYMTK